MSKKYNPDANPALQFLPTAQHVQKEPEPKTEEKPAVREGITAEQVEKALEAGLTLEDIETVAEIKNKRIQIVVTPSLYRDMENYKFLHRERSMNDLINKAIIAYIKGEN